MAPTPIIRCEQYLKFIGENALNQVQLPNGLMFKYFDCGPKKADLPPLICISGSSGTCHAFFMQLTELSDKGYRVISVNIPVVWTHDEFAKALSHFMDQMGIGQAHFYGVSLGGFLAQVFCKLYPKKVLSLALTNSLCDTTSFSENASVFSSAYCYMPEFYLRSLILESFPKSETFPPGVAEAINFQVDCLDTLSQEELASRITLNVIAGSSSQINRPNCLRELSDEKITLIDSMDSTLSSALRDQLYTIHPEAKQALIKSGGDFPYIARFEEVNVHLIVHLRRNGLFI